MHSVYLDSSLVDLSKEFKIGLMSKGEGSSEVASTLITNPKRFLSPVSILIK